MGLTALMTSSGVNVTGAVWFDRPSLFAELSTPPTRVNIANMVPARRAMATSPSNRVNPASALADRERGATIASQRRRMAKRRVEPIRQLAFREGPARCPAPASAVGAERWIRGKGVSGGGEVAGGIGAGSARRAEAVQRDRIQVAAGGAVLVGASPRIQRQLAFEVRPVPAQPQLRVGGRPNQKVEAFFGRGISSDIEAHRIRRGFMHAYLRLRGDNLGTLQPLEQARPNQRAEQPDNGKNNQEFEEGETILGLVLTFFAPEQRRQKTAGYCQWLAPGKSSLRSQRNIVDARDRGEQRDHDHSYHAPDHKNRDRFRSEEHTSELQSHLNLVCRLLLEKKKPTTFTPTPHDPIFVIFL